MTILSSYELGLRLIANCAISGDDLIWGRYTNGRYGKTRVPGQRSDSYVHRIAYVMYHGGIGDDLTVDHVHDAGCRSRLCFRKEHLEAVSMQVNNDRRVRNTHCPHGHELTPDNIYWVNTSKNGKGYKSRRCRTCVLANMRKQYEKTLASSDVTQ